MGPPGLAELPSLTFGGLCIASALPFLGVPFPSRAAATYYEGKNQWLSQLSRGRLTPRQAGFASALLRVAVGGCCIYPPTRLAALLVNGAVVLRGTTLAMRDGRPMLPQWGMLGAMAVCIGLDIWSK